MKTWESGGIAPPFLTSALGGGEWSASRPGRMAPQGNHLWYPSDSRLGGSHGRSGRCEEEKNHVPASLQTLAIQPLVYQIPYSGHQWAAVASPGKEHTELRSYHFMCSLYPEGWYDAS
jgi:hypothetical protein